jgi:hypothetical protein
MSAKAALLGLVVALAACGAYPVRARTIVTTDLGNPDRAKISNYMAFKDGIAENTPQGISRAVVSDEAYLLPPTDRTCVALVERTWVDRDMPLSDWNFRLNGMAVAPENEQAAAKDYSYASEQEIVSADAVLPQLVGSLRITRPTTEVYRVVERTATVCAPRVASNAISLTAEYAVGSLGNMGQVFQWSVAQ